MLRAIVAVLVFGATALAAAGEDAITLKLSKPKAGESIKVVKTEKTKSSVTFAANGKSQAKDDTVTKNIVYVDEAITVGADGRPTKVTRTYEKYEVSKGGKDDDTPPLKTAILIEKKDGKFLFTADGKPVDAATAAKLSAEFDKPAGAGSVAELLPAKPVKPGETWKVDGAKMAAMLGGDASLVLDTDKSELNGKLVKTYQKDGKQYGVLEFSGAIVIKSLGDKVPFKLKAGSQLGFKMTTDTCVDGTDPGLRTNGTMSVKMEAEGNGITLSVNATGAITETRELVKK